MASSLTCTLRFHLLLLVTFCLLVSLLTPPLTDALKFRPYRLSYDVYIRNGIAKQGPLVIHCKSRDDDLGIHSLNLNDIFHWHFRINIFRRTLFFCRMIWAQKNTSFDAFYANEEGVKCDLDGQCRWIVKEDGFYFGCDEASVKKKHDWTGKK